VRCAIELDGRPWAVLDGETVLREGLKAGARLDPDGLAALLRRDEVIRARAAALRRLALQPRSAMEARRCLLASGFGEAVVDEAIAALESEGALDDAALARRWAARRRRQGDFAPARIEAELIARGIEPTVAQRVATGSAEPDLIGDCARLLLRRRSRFEPLAEAPNLDRVRAFLARRGFEPEVIEAALARVLGEAYVEPDAPSD